MSRLEIGKMKESQGILAVVGDIVVGDFPEAEKASKEVLSLPMYLERSKENIKKIIENIIMKINKGER